MDEVKLFGSINADEVYEVDAKPAETALNRDIFSLGERIIAQEKEESGMMYKISNLFSTSIPTNSLADMKARHGTLIEQSRDERAWNKMVLNTVTSSMTRTLYFNSLTADELAKVTGRYILDFGNGRQIEGTFKEGRLVDGTSRYFETVEGLKKAHEIHFVCEKGFTLGEDGTVRGEGQMVHTTDYKRGRETVTSTGDFDRSMVNPEGTTLTEHFILSFEGKPVAKEAMESKRGETILFTGHDGEKWTNPVSPDSVQTYKFHTFMK